MNKNSVINRINEIKEINNTTHPKFSISNNHLKLCGIHQFVGMII